MVCHTSSQQPPRRPGADHQQAARDPRGRPEVVNRKGIPMGSVRVAIVGVGNCATSLIQGVEYYKDADPTGTVPGLMHVVFGAYHNKDVEFVVAFDVDDKTVGKDLPVFIAADPEWAKKFEDAGVPIVGDDIKSQVGATITHRVMAKLFEDRGVQLDRTMQLNVGGNMDFLNMLERSRLESKKISKTQAVTSNLQREFNTKDVHIGPSDHVGWLDDRKWAYVRLEGRAFGDVPLNLEYKLEVWDSPNSAGVIIDAVRVAKIAKDRGIGGPVVAASAYLMKSPPKQLPDDIARAELETFIEG